MASYDLTARVRSASLRLGNGLQRRSSLDPGSRPRTECLASGCHAQVEWTGGRCGGDATSASGAHAQCCSRGDAVVFGAFSSQSASQQRMATAQEWRRVSLRCTCALSGVVYLWPGSRLGLTLAQNLETSIPPVNFFSARQPPSLLPDHATRSRLGIRKEHLKPWRPTRSSQRSLPVTKS